MDPGDSGREAYIAIAHAAVVADRLFEGLLTSAAWAQGFRYFTSDAGLLLCVRRDIEAVVSWFRSNHGRVMWLALFALTCQLVLSFGHVHLDKVRIAPTPGTASVAIAVNSSQDFAALPRAPPQAPKKGPVGLGDDFCALCASIHLAGALVVPSAPPMASPVSLPRTLTWTHVALVLAVVRHLSFDARGPPHA